MGFGIKELLVVLVIVILLFGTKKLKNIGSDLGSAIKGFKNSVADDENTDEKPSPVDPTLEKSDIDSSATEVKAKDKQDQA